MIMQMKYGIFKIENVTVLFVLNWIERKKSIASYLYHEIYLKCRAYFHMALLNSERKFAMLSEYIDTGSFNR